MKALSLSHIHTRLQTLMHIHSITWSIIAPKSLQTGALERQDLTEVTSRECNGSVI